ncbi:hypothetical protein NL526_29835, partial [Klebsiella pneumoniae]|nr:hypothetical protein [Klebsiella pneumoniae]
FLFLPLEDAAFLLFTQLLTRGLPATQQPNRVLLFSFPFLSSLLFSSLTIRFPSPLSFPLRSIFASRFMRDSIPVHSISLR